MPPNPRKHHLKVDGVLRRYLVYVPAGYDGTPRPVVLMFHGTGGIARWTMRETRLDEKADEAGCLAVFPEGLPPDPTKIALFLKNPPSWDAAGGGRHDDLGFVAALLDELPRQYAVDTRRVYAAGFSNGASFVFRLARHFADRLAAIGPVAGPCLTSDPPPSRPVPTMFLVGTKDPLLPLHGGAVPTPWGQTLHRPPLEHTWQTWAAALGCPAEPWVESEEGITRLTFGPCGGGAEMVGVTIEGHGHHWPGGRGELAEEIAGSNSSPVRANDLLWDFFRRHPLP